jgi:cell pole-organizing protein PopZ
MTRLDASNEPSMEDILASIRKIIAEDPPGSRPVPQSAPQPMQRAQPAAAYASPAQAAASASTSSPFGRTQQQEPYFQPSFVQTPDADVASVTPEPYLRAGPARADMSALTPAPFFPSRSDAGPQAPRVEPSFAAMAGPVEKDEPVAPSPELSSAAMSVEEQLSGLLGDSGLIGDVATKDSQPHVTEGLAGARDASIGLRQDQDARPGFTISSDGYMPSKVEAETERDPFDFDLGPSPFEAKAASAPGVIAADLGGFIPSRYGEPVTTEKVAAVQPAPIFPLATAAPAVEPEPAPAVSSFSAQLDTLQRSPALDSPLLDSPAPAMEPVFIAPSVAATLQPPASAFETARPDMVEAAPTPAAAIHTPPDEPMSFEHESVDVAHTLVEDDVVAATVVGERGEASTAQRLADFPVPTSMTLPAVGQRTMEDAIAELLRPMLKSWLSENMPKIVERALRRELTEQLHSEHKAAAE